MSEKEEAVDLALCLWTGRGLSSNTFQASPPPERRGLLWPRGEEEGDDGSAGIAATLDGSRSKSPEDDEDSGGGGVRKKLRLSKEQSSLLEESFRQHNTLNPIEKRVLAERLNLRQRQVEVWFQNHRARKKLKQTEIDKEYLKKRCESLNDENRKLREELRELRSIKLSGCPMYVRPSNMTTMAMTTMLVLCPSCERVSKGGMSDDRAVTVAVAVKPKLYEQGVIAKDSNITCCK